jgi:hypothetical protein
VVSFDLSNMCQSKNYRWLTSNMINKECSHFCDIFSTSDFLP